MIDLGLLFDQHSFLFEVGQLFAYVHTVLLNLRSCDYCVIAANFFICACVFYACCFLHNLVKKRRFLIRFIVIALLCICVQAFAVAFRWFLDGCYTAYSLHLIFPYFVVYITAQRLFEKYRRGLSRKVLRILKFDFYSVFNWVFATILLSYFLPNSENIQAGFVKLFVGGIFFIFIISIILLRRIVLESIRYKENELLKRVLKIFYSGSWLLICLFLFMWMSPEPFFKKFEKFLLSVTIFTSLYLGKWSLKIIWAARIKRSKYEDELWQVYKFVNFLWKVLLDPIIAIIVFYIWGYHVIDTIFEVVGPMLSRRLIYLFILFVIFRITLIFSNVLVRVYVRDRSKDEEIAKRFDTLIHILNIFFKIMLFTVFLFFALVIMGVNPSPVFANFWILTAGLSFGLQTLLRDFAVGVIMMFEDTFHIGDEVEVDGISGQVEEITLRVLKIRDTEGALISIPFNRVEKFSNKSRGYIFLLFRIVVEVATDSALVSKLMSQAADELSQLPEYKKAILDTIKISGPINISATGCVFEGRLKVKPMGTKTARGVYYGICQKLFAKAKIKFAHDIKDFQKLFT